MSEPSPVQSRGRPVQSAITLATSFRHNGFDFRLLKRVGDVALFEKRKPTHSRSFFEVVIVQKRPETTFPGGRVVSAHEAMPASEQWGTAGWSYSDQAEAERRFGRLVKARQDGPPMPAHGPKQASELAGRAVNRLGPRPARIGSTCRRARTSASCGRKGSRHYENKSTNPNGCGSDRGITP